MQIQVNTDNHIEGNAKLIGYVETVVSDTLGRFNSRITRVEVQLTDENSSKKKGNHDMRCAMEARLNGMKPIAVSHHGGTLDQAIDGCVKKLEQTLDRTLEKYRDTKSRNIKPTEPEM